MIIKQENDKTLIDSIGKNTSPGETIPKKTKKLERIRIGGEFNDIEQFTGLKSLNILHKILTDYTAFL